MGNIMDFDQNVVTSSILKITDFTHYQPTNQPTNQSN